MGKRLNGLNLWIPPLSSQIYPRYVDLKSEIFSKIEARSFPALQPSDSTIKLLSGTVPSKGILYSFSSPESKVLDEYIWGAGHGDIPSSSAVWTGFLFVEKRTKCCGLVLTIVA